MYNLNPDITVNNPQGGHWFMPGLLSRRYEEMGGRVHYFGKPHKVMVGGRGWEELPIALRATVRNLYRKYHRLRVFYTTRWWYFDRCETDDTKKQLGSMLFPSPIPPSPAFYAFYDACLRPRITGTAHRAEN